MRVCYLTEADISLNNGRGINEREFIDAAVRSSLLDFRCVAPEPANPENYRNESIDYVVSHRHSGLNYPRFVAAAYRKIAALHEEIGLDGVATRLDVSPIVAYAVQRRLSLPVLLKMLMVRGAFSTFPAWPTGPSHLAKRIFRPLFRSVVENSVGADTVSWVLQEELRSLFGFAEDDLILLRNGANLDRFQPGDRRRDRRDLALDRFDRLIGYVGALADRRHLDSLLRAFERITRDHPGLGLVFVGDGGKRSELEDFVRRSRIEDRVLFTGRVPYGEVPKYMRAFDAGIDLSVTPVRYSGKKRYISFSQKSAQYLGSGCPVIGWKLRDMEFLEEAEVGWTAPIGDTERLSQVLSIVGKGDSADLVSIGRRARRYAEEHLAAKRLTERRLEFWIRQING